MLLWKHLLILKVVPKAASANSVHAFLRSHWSIFLVYNVQYIHSRLSEQFSESQAGFGTTSKGTGGYQKAGTSSLN